MIEIKRDESALDIKEAEERTSIKSTEREPWTPKGIWGHKNPAEMTLEEKEKMLEKAKYSGLLATAYWENEIANHQEKPARAEAEVKKKRADELKKEILKLNETLIRIKKEEKTEPKSEEREMNQELIKLTKEELGEKKKGMGERFKDGVKSAYNFFKKKLIKEKSEPEKEMMSQEELEKKIDEFKKEIRRLREERYRRSREVGVMEQGKIEQVYQVKIKELEDKILALEKGDGKKLTGKNVLGFLAERTKGFFGGFGWWEAHQAEKFRLGTKEAGQDLKSQSALLEQEEGRLDIDEAWEEAQEIEKKREKEEKDWMENYGANSKEAKALAVEFLSKQISGRKSESNQKIEDKMITVALAKLENNLKNKSWVEEYKAANGGKVITPEKMQEVEEKIRAEIKKLRKGQLKKDLVDFVKLSRNSLDKRWWSRYIYAGMDAVLAGLLLKWFVSRGVEKVVAEKAIAEKVTEGTGEIIGGGAEKVLEVGMKDHVWGETKRFLIDQGFPNPTNADIMKYAKMVAEDSGVAVKEWGLDGKILDTQMPAGYLLKFGRVAGELAKLGF